MTPRERADTRRAFASSAGLLLATDAASEGLNLHERCRIVVHFELPWTPLRLEQRTGRVDRLGQRRTVHEILLVARDTAERLVLAPLLERARQSASRRASALMTALTESAVASAVMSGVSPEPEPARPSPADRIDLLAAAAAESVRLAHLRHLGPRAGQARRKATGVAITSSRRRDDRVIVIVDVALEHDDGRRVHSGIVIFERRLVHGRWPRSAADAVDLGRRIIDAHGPALLRSAAEHLEEPSALAAAQWRAMAHLAADRERAITSALPSLSQRLVQAGLFDRRSLIEADARHEAASWLRAEAGERLASLLPEAGLHARPRIVAVRAGWIRP